MLKKLLIISGLLLATACAGTAKNENDRLTAEAEIKEASTLVSTAKSYKLDMSEADKQLTQATTLFKDDRYKESIRFSDSVSKLATDAINQYEISQDKKTLTKIKAAEISDAEALRLAAEEKRRGEASQKYTVQSGDSLWSIAASNKTLARDALSWPLIYKSNQSIISDPDLIRPDMTLLIKPAANSEQLNKARQHARSRGHWRPGIVENSDQQYLQQ